ncbi:TPA: ATP-dependent helicase [Enterococcus faecalis]|uniref:UvrD-helicase domain-containing protein n=1 Tax=Enterococcus faecalis TaxID=1351 RepID=UPI0001B2EA51|nr:ATP-dependent helicase [Enterococcus faecalis]EEU79922.1 DNA helicase [Enterococcus faecalis Fly1]MDU1451427.1 ATP-dependent helicase [Enterococcus faecalis]HBI1770670.1 ATP-dependent helicase [Enterococcus faecalis]HBI1794083.1 ATP-dependent helicase [Enterococcus faecalis]HBI1800817.1 ATP-dependent helicase [Enterococcus faecalis]
MVQKTDWLPTDGLTFEEGALNAIKDTTNTLVKAGPGSGKTELLAQKANYLLQTNLCPAPQKILAISFKKDAAVNLAERVSKRIPENKVSQFYSVTFDSFAKGLLDRFLHGIPEEWRPSDDYEVDLSLNEFARACKENGVYLRYKLEKNIREAELVKYPLTELRDIDFDIWKTMLHGNSSGKSYLTFKMITRLVIFLLKNNPAIVESIRKTYKFVFLDEFQDTTVLQYELFSLCFKTSENFITAVGDDRQKIMRWAGALPDAFLSFKHDFLANQHALYINRRSDVKIQKLLQELNEYAKGDFLGKTELVTTGIDSEAIIQVKTFSSSEEETQDIVDMIEKLCAEGKNIEEFCILVKQFPDIYVAQLSPLFNEKGIDIRNEAEFQDLLKENITILILDSLRAALVPNDSDAWISVLNFLHDFSDSKNYFDLKREEDIVLKTKKLLKHIAKKLSNVVSFEELFDVFQYIINFYGIDNIRSQFPEYTNLGFLETKVRELCDSLYSYYEKTSDWVESILCFKGKNCIPVMTIHKSKGLEFDTVFLLGMDDQSFWSFRDNPEETTATLFVAISRAKKNFITTFTSKRSGRNCERILISDYYDVFRKSGVVEFFESR